MKTPSLTVTIPRGYTNAPYAEDFVDPVLGDYILSVDLTGDPLTVLDVDLYHKGTGNSVPHSSPYSSWAADDYSIAVWFYIPEGCQVYVEVLSKRTVVSVWE